MSGDGGNGKTGFAAMIQAMLGPDNVSHQSWFGLGQRFGLAITAGKLLNYSDEASEFDRVAEHVLKQYTNGSPITVEEKGEKAFTMIPTARLMMSANTLPRVADRTDAYWRRMLLLPFGRKIPADRRIKGLDQPEWWEAKVNLSGVLCWALDGLRRLRERGKFTEPRSSETEKAELRRENNPVSLFFEEFVTPGGWLVTQELYLRYQRWGIDNGLKPLSAVAFGREVKRFYPDAQPLIKRFGSRVQRIWDGVQWRTETVEIPEWAVAFVGAGMAHIVETEFDYDSWTDEDAVREAMEDELLAVGLSR